MSLPVRSVHVLAMAVILGGAALAWAVVERRWIDGGDGNDAIVAIAWLYERAFWVAAGAAVLTGVGNLGVMAPAVPGPGTGWGLAFAVKLGGVCVLLVGSLLRTAVVWTAGRAPDAPDHGQVLRVAYGATTVLVVGLVLLAEVIAHG